MINRISSLLTLSLLVSATLHASEETSQAATPAEQDAKLLSNTQGKGYGPQAPRDLDSPSGSNRRSFEPAPSYHSMNLCNIHFHNAAEHRGGEFTTPDNKGGFRYSGSISASEATPLPSPACKNVQAGDTIEVHFVFSTAQVTPGPTLGACLSEALQNPQLRVEAQVMLMVNDATAANFQELVAIGERQGYQQALNIPENQGIPVEYAGSTTGPQYNEKGSPLQVSWRVRPKVLKVDIKSLGDWCAGNVFNEDHGHGVRNLIRAPELLSEIAPAGQ